MHVRSRVNRAIVPSCSRRNTMTKSYDPPLTTNPHGPLYRVDKGIRVAQQRLDAAIDAKRHHTSQNPKQGSECTLFGVKPKQGSECTLFGVKRGPKQGSERLSLACKGFGLAS